VARRGSDRARTGAPVAVESFWLPSGDGDAAATWYRPVAADGTIAAPDAADTAVVVVGGIVHEDQTMAVGLVALARELAGHGVPALTFDLAGTAQGRGDLDAPDIGVRWSEDVRAAVRHVRESGIGHVVVVGVRLGALLAAHATVDDPVDELVMWAPVMSGRRYVRELRIMAAAVAEQGATVEPDPADDGGTTVAGFRLPGTLTAHLATLDAAKLDGKPASRISVFDDEARLAEIDPEHPLLAAVPVARVVTTSTERWLFTAADAFPAPFEDLATVRRHVVRAAAAHRAATPDGAAPLSADLASSTSTSTSTSPARSHVTEHDGVAIRETLVAFERADGGVLRGVLSEPVGDVDPAVAYLAVTSVGPGRIFVDLARREAARGRVSLRFELAGFGASDRPGDGRWADFYDPGAADDIAAAVAHLRARGHERVRVVGFCAGGWSAIRTAPPAGVVGIVAINTQLAVRSRLLHRRPWPGLRRYDAVLAELGGRPQVRRIVEKLERDHPVPSPALRSIGRHVRAGSGVTLMYAEGDLGHRSYVTRVARPGGLRRSRRPDVRVYRGLGHLPSGPARRRLLDDVHDLD